MCRVLMIILVSLSPAFRFLAASDAGELVGQTLKTIVVPAAQEAKDAAVALAVAQQHLQAKPTLEQLSQVKKQWHVAKDTWEYFEPMLWGPAYKKRFRADFWPTRDRNIKRLLASDEPLTPASMIESGASVNGLPALGYVLFAVEPTKLVADQRMLSYLSAVADAYAETITTMASQWDGLSEAQQRGLIASSGAQIKESATGPQALDGMFEIMLGVASRAIREQLEKPMGLEKNKGPRSQQVESPHSQRGLRDLYHNIRGLAGIIGEVNGGPVAMSLAALLEKRRAGAGKEVQATATRALTEAMALRDENLAELVVKDPEMLHDLLSALRILRTELKTRVTAVLGVTIYFGDSDGD